MPFLRRGGHELFYREAGQGPLLVVLPGNTSSSACHRGELDHFSRWYHVVSLDFRGTGQSGRVQTWPDDWWERCADDVAALRSHLGETEVTVMGTSGGGVIALKVALRHPGSVRAVVADSCLSRMPPHWVEELLEARRAATPEQMAFWSFAHGDDWRGPVEADSDLLRRFGEAGSDWFGETLDEIECPVLLTASVRDAALPRVGSEISWMVSRIPRAEAHLFSSGDHPLMWTRPEAFRRVARSFLDRVDGGSTGGDRGD